MKKQIGIFIGSLRKDSYTKKVAHALPQLLPKEYEAIFIDISTLELYNQELDDDNHPTTAWVNFRQKVQPLDGLIFATPEYNRSIPGVLKNALDVGSRPFGENVWNNKPAAVISVSPGAIGGFGANHHLRQSLVFLNVPAMQQPEAYIGKIDAALDKNGQINEQLLRFLQTVMTSYISFFENYTKK